MFAIEQELVGDDKMGGRLPFVVQPEAYRNMVRENQQAPW